jgi:transcriptional regulator with XRE-family HTH domain
MAEKIATLQQQVSTFPVLLEEVHRLRDLIVFPEVPPETRRNKSSDEFPVYLYEWRKSRGKNLDDLAAEVRLSISQLSRVENGLQAYTQQILEGYARALGCRPSDLIGRPPTYPERALRMPLIGAARQDDKLTAGGLPAAKTG